MRLTSGTSRDLPEGTPGPVCQGGLVKEALFPPPPLVHPTSVATVPSAASVRLVPPTETTQGSEDSYSTCRGPSDPCPVWSGFDPASPLETNTFTPRAASWRNFWC